MGMPLISMKVLKQRGRKRLSFIPNFFTLSNALFGFLSVIAALDNNSTMAAYCLVAAAVMDCLDGRLARALGTTSSLGMELDSLCDAISFCFAPTILLYSWSLYQGHGISLVVLVIYLWAGLFRLAKFNASSGGAPYHFEGLPTTVASFFIAQYVLQFEWLRGSLLYPLAWPSTMVALPLVLAILKISTIPFSSFKALGLSARGFIKIFFFLIGMWIMCGSALLFLLTLSYIVVHGALYVFNSLAKHFRVVKD